MLLFEKFKFRLIVFRISGNTKRSNKQDLNFFEVFYFQGTIDLLSNNSELELWSFESDRVFCISSILGQAMFRFKQLLNVAI